MMSGFRKDDPATVKKLPVEVDIPEYLASFGRRQDSSARDCAIGDLTLIAFYYLLRIGEYTAKRYRNETKQTVNFRVVDVTFFKKGDDGRLRQLPRNASKEEILSADSATLRLTNQKNGWKGVCINHHINGQTYYCPVKALARRILHIREHSTDTDLGICAFFSDGKRFDVTEDDVRHALKFAGKQLNYPERGIPIERIDTHSLRGGGANALSLAGYSDRAIQKMGRWRSAFELQQCCSGLNNIWRPGRNDAPCRRGKRTTICNGHANGHNVIIVLTTGRVRPAGTPSGLLPVCSFTTNSGPHKTLLSLAPRPAGH